MRVTWLAASRALPASRFRQPRLQPRVALFLSGFAVMSALGQTGCSKSAPPIKWSATPRCATAIWKPRELRDDSTRCLPTWTRTT